VSNATAGTLSTLLSPVATRVLPSAPTTATAGRAFAITVTAVDALGNTLTNYTGTVHFSSTDPNPKVALPADYTFLAGDHGVHTFTGVTLDTAGARILLVSDTAAPDRAGSFTVKVSPAAVARFKVAGPTTATAGTAFTLTVSALDAFGNVVTGYRGTVSLSDSVGGATLPGDYTFVGSDHGKHSFSVTLNTTGRQTLTVEETAHTTIQGTHKVLVDAPQPRSGLAGDGPDPASGDADFAGGDG
jgi:hypothetical protein